MAPRRSLHAAPTDRFVVEWWLQRLHVAAHEPHKRIAAGAQVSTRCR
jgi:hypothetical protein